jgi:hypothetical protein
MCPFITGMVLAAIQVWRDALMPPGAERTGFKK